MGNDGSGTNRNSATRPDTDKAADASADEWRCVARAAQGKWAGDASGVGWELILRYVKLPPI